MLTDTDRLQQRFKQLQEQEGRGITGPPVFLSTFFEVPGMLKSFTTRVDSKMLSDFKNLIPAGSSVQAEVARLIKEEVEYKTKKDDKKQNVIERMIDGKLYSTSKAKHISTMILNPGTYKTAALYQKSTGELFMHIYYRGDNREYILLQDEIEFNTVLSGFNLPPSVADIFPE